MTTETVMDRCMECGTRFDISYKGIEYKIENPCKCGKCEG